MGPRSIGLGVLLCLGLTGAASAQDREPESPTFGTLDRGDGSSRIGLDVALSTPASEFAADDALAQLRQMATVSVIVDIQAAEL